MQRGISAVLAVVSVACGVIGCSTERRITNTAATGLQQLLTTAAIDRAVQKLVLPELDGHTVYIQTGSLAAWGEQLKAGSPAVRANQFGSGSPAEWSDHDYVYLNAAVAALLSERGAKVTLDPAQADTIISVLAGSIGTDEQDVLFGMPASASMFLPIALPELALYKAQDQEGFAKVELVATDTKTGGTLFRSGPTYGTTYVHNRTVLFIGWYTTDTSRMRE